MKRKELAGFMKTDVEFYESVMKKSRKRAAGRFYTVITAMLVVCTVSAAFTFLPARVNNAPTGGGITLPGINGTTSAGDSESRPPCADSISPPEAVPPGDPAPPEDVGKVPTNAGNNNVYNSGVEKGTVPVRVRQKRFLSLFLPTLAVCTAIAAAAFVRWKKINER